MALRLFSASRTAATSRSLFALAILLTLTHLPALAQSANTSPATIPALFLTDIHFDPFHDPAKVPQLAAAPVSQWQTILAAPASPDQPQAFAALQKTCHARAADTSYDLLHSSLQAMHTQASSAAFVTLSGDLLAHQFDCRFHTTLPSKSPADYDAFVEKTLRFLSTQLQSTLPRRPIYIALGNNDSACGDYRLDPGSSFLITARKIIASALPPAQRTQLPDFAATGGYSVTLPAPLRRTRLIVLDDLFLSRKYETCGGQPDPAAAIAQLTWLRKQLQSARLHHEKVWVMGHIPPGVDAYSTFSHLTNVCDGGKPTTFLSSDALSDLLVEYASTIQLAIFGHTHMDEMHLLTSATVSDTSSEPPTEVPLKAVPLKMVPSISPVDGNNPAFTLAQISPKTSRLVDYQVIAASNQTGLDTTWSPEYSFQDTYHQPEFSALTLSTLLDGFQSDPSASTPPSQAYLRNYFVGDRSLLLRTLWPQYTCSLAHPDVKGFDGCVCALPK